jgi:hypothetical protein
MARVHVSSTIAMLVANQSLQMVCSLTTDERIQIGQASPENVWFHDNGSWLEL